MAIPKTLKPIDADKALKIIEKHIQNGTGQYEYANSTGDFIYKTKTGYYLIRNCFGHFETGKVVM